MLTKKSNSPRRSIKATNAGLFLIFAVSVVLQGCESQHKPGYFEEYESAIVEVNNLLAPESEDAQNSDALFENMELLFSDLKHPELEQRIEKTYASDLYFNDTLRTYRTLDEVADYLLETADRVIETRAQFVEISRSDESFFVRWKMSIKINVNGDIIETESIGVSQVKFNASGKVVFHQDFWDNTEGLFRHLPVVGYVLNKTIKKL